MTVSQNGDIIIWKVPVTNDSAHVDTNVRVTNTFSVGLSYVSSELTKGVYVPTTGVWTVGDMASGSTETLTIYTKVLNIANAPFNLSSVVVGTLLDPNLTNNALVQTVAASSAPPTGGASPTTRGCLCGTVSDEVTECTSGTTEYRLVAGSVTNSTTFTWDTATGDYSFTPIDPTVVVTFKFDLYCVNGANSYLIAQNVQRTISKQLESKATFNHTMIAKKWVDMTLQEQTEIQALYPAVVWADFCWDMLKNASGNVTSAKQLDCSSTQDTRTFHFCSAIDCIPIVNNCPTCPQAQLPADVALALAAITGYTPELGDTIVVQHPNATSVYEKLALGWTRNTCGCTYKVSQQPGNLITLNAVDDAPFLDAASIAAIAYVHPDHTGDVTSLGDGATAIVANAVTATKIASNAVTTSKIASNAVTVAKLPAGAAAGLYLEGNGTWSAPPTAGGGLTMVDTDASIDGTGTAVDPIKLAASPANTILTNATAGAAQPTPLAVPASRLIGRTATSNIVPLELGAGFSFAGNVLNYTPTVAGDNWGTQVVQHAPNGFTTGAGTAATAGAGVKLQNGVTTGDVITWNGTQWVSQAAPSQATLGYNETFAANLAVPAATTNYTGATQSFTGLTGDWYASANIGLVGTYTAVPATTGLVTVRIKKNATIIAQQYINVDLTNAGARISCSPNAMVGLIAADVLSIEIDTANSFVFDAFSNFSIIEVTRGI